MNGSVSLSLRLASKLRSGLRLKEHFLVRRLACCSATASGSGASSALHLAAQRTIFKNDESVEHNQHDSSRKFSMDEEKAASANYVVSRKPMVAYPQKVSSLKPVPPHIPRPPYAASGTVVASPFQDQILLHDATSAARMKRAAQLARSTLDLACQLAQPGITTDEIDTAVHNAIIEAGAYPSPLNYAGFPKSLCSSINEVICHGIPDTRPLQFGDVVSFDVSCFLDGVHGDNCATVIVGDSQAVNEIGTDWRGIPYRATLTNETDYAYFKEARRLVTTTRESLYAAIAACRPGGCLSDIGAAIHDVADREGYSSVRKYRGHGICHEFHCAPFVKHFRNDDRVPLKPGMIFTIEPMLTQGSEACFEWDDQWTVLTVDGYLSAQFEHTVLITEDGVDILTSLDGM